MSKVRTVLSRLGTASAVGVGALALTFAATGPASAVSAGWFTTLTACNQSGHNIVDRPGSSYTSWSCVHSSTHNPPWQLILS